jgi:predicted kinase
MPTLHAMMGLPGSGKSHMAITMLQTHNAPWVCPDNIRKQLTGDINDQSKNDEVFDEAHGQVRNFLDRGNNVVFDATNVSQRARDELLAIAKETEAITHLHVIDTPIDVCRARMEARGRVVPEESFRKMVIQYNALIHTRIPFGGRAQSLIIEEEPWDHITIHSTREIR